MNENKSLSLGVSPFLCCGVAINVRAKLNETNQPSTGSRARGGVRSIVWYVNKPRQVSAERSQSWLYGKAKCGKIIMRAVGDWVFVTQLVVGKAKQKQRKENRLERSFLLVERGFYNWGEIENWMRMVQWKSTRVTSSNDFTHFCLFDENTSWKILWIHLLKSLLGVFLLFQSEIVKTKHIYWI